MGSFSVVLSGVTSPWLAVANPSSPPTTKPPFISLSFLIALSKRGPRANEGNVEGPFVLAANFFSPSRPAPASGVCTSTSPLLAITANSAEEETVELAGACCKTMSLGTISPTSSKRSSSSKSSMKPSASCC
jgi:hypothetical protein